MSQPKSVININWSDDGGATEEVPHAKIIVLNRGDPSKDFLNTKAAEPAESPRKTTTPNLESVEIVQTAQKIAHQHSEAANETPESTKKTPRHKNLEHTKDHPTDAKDAILETAENAKKSAEENLEYAKERATEVKDHVVENAQWAKDQVIENAQVAKDHVVENAQWAKDKVVDNAHVAKDHVVENAQWAKDRVTEVKDRAVENAQAAKDQVVENAQVAKDRVVENAQWAKDKVVDNAQWAKDHAVENAESAKEGLIENLTYAKDVIVENAESAKEGLIDNLTYAKDQVVENAQWAKERATDNLEYAKEQVLENAEHAKDALIENAENLSGYKLTKDSPAPIPITQQQDFYLASANDPAIQILELPKEDEKENLESTTKESSGSEGGLLNILVSAKDALIGTAEIVTGYKLTKDSREKTSTTTTSSEKTPAQLAKEIREKSLADEF
jgi:hypothetical protein